MTSLYSERRLSALIKGEMPTARKEGDERNHFETDFDRILFSAPIRRLADKTQVFPQEIDDSVRNRLTHSHEVSNLCRSMVLQISRKCDANPFGCDAKLDTVIPVITAIGLAHDVGNPPFGHKGEVAIGNWIKDNIKNGKAYKGSWQKLSKPMQQDLLKWEGNAQAFRLLSKLQLAKGNMGLDLTATTMAALMKYTGPSDKTDKRAHPAKKKFGFFQDDLEVAKKVLSEVGVKMGERHPLAYLMEACDDTAYSVIDIEDGIQKKLVSLNDLIVILKQPDHNDKQDPVSLSVAERLEQKIEEMRKDDRKLSEIDEIARQYFRSFAIGEFVVAATKTYIQNKDEIIAGSFSSDLISSSPAAEFCNKLKGFAFQNIYLARDVVRLEVNGANVLHSLMSYYWQAIFNNFTKDKDDVSFFDKYVYEHISRNYRAISERAIKSAATENHLYYQLLLLTDMISGMTEDFAERTLEHFKSLDPEMK